MLILLLQYELGYDVRYPKVNKIGTKKKLVNFQIARSSLRKHFNLNQGKWRIPLKLGKRH